MYYVNSYCLSFNRLKSCYNWARILWVTSSIDQRASITTAFFANLLSAIQARYQACACTKNSFPFNSCLSPTPSNVLDKPISMGISKNNTRSGRQDSTIGLFTCQIVSIPVHFVYHWYEREDQKHLSDTTIAPLSSAGLITVLMSWALAALYRYASQIGSISSGNSVPWTSVLIASAIGVLPGSRTRMTSLSGYCAWSCSTRIFDCVVFPVPTVHSRTMYMIFNKNLKLFHSKYKIF